MTLPRDVAVYNPSALVHYAHSGGQDYKPATSLVRVIHICMFVCHAPECN